MRAEYYANDLQTERRDQETQDQGGQTGEEEVREAYEEKAAETEHDAVYGGARIRF